ncbi:hypothetical protein PMIN02_008665 [Paraphaeosphaeria minitans]
MATTRATLWVQRHPRKPIKWAHGPDSTSKDGFNVEFPENVQIEKYLSVITTSDGDRIASTRSDTFVDRRLLTVTKDVVAVKSFVNASPTRWNERVQDMRSELEAIQKAHHLHVVEAIGSYTHINTVAFIMKPCADCTLAEVLARFGRDTSSKAKMEERCGRELELFLPFTMGCLAHALSHIHSKLIKHKDIKPQNILFHNNRVVLADFGISKIFDDHSTSIGPTGKSSMYAFYETIDHNERGRSQDVFSLACVFFEIFAVYKGESADVLSSVFSDDRKNYASNIDKVLEWVRNHVVERCDVQILELIRNMTLKPRKQRLFAREVWSELVTVRSNDDTSVHFCGACCMPRNPNRDGNISSGDSLPDPADHGDGLSSADKTALQPPIDVTKDLNFKSKYSATDMLPYTWDRNIWLGPTRLVDSVGFRNEEHHLCRKSFWVTVSKKNELEKDRREVKAFALAEAEMLKKVTHPHIVKLRDMYRQGPDTFVIVTTPVTRYNLAQYLPMVELKRKGGANIGDWKKTLRISPGCLANAVNWLHTKHNIVHGNIEAENILVAPDAYQKIILAHFKYAARKVRAEDMARTQYGSPQDEAYYMNENQYASPDHPSSKWAQPPDDIFSLGCVFMEMETVRSGRSLREMHKFLLGETESESTDTTEGARTRESDEENTRRQPPIQYKRPEVLDKIPHWLKQIGSSSSGFYELACKMMQADAKLRPSAEHVLGDIARCKVGKEPMCGNDCMPHRGPQDIHELPNR